MRTTVVLPESVYATIREIAASEQRSAHQQIIYALTRYVDDEVRRRRLSGRPALQTEGRADD